MNKITALTIFRRVIELGTFRAAADDLNLSQAAVSKNINELEDFLGIALINRTTRRMNVTESGQAYYNQICHVLDELDSADRSVMAASYTPRGRLRVSVPMSYGLIKVNAVICDFKCRYPDISIEVLLCDSYIDLIDKGIDVVIRGGGGLDDSSMRSRLVTRVPRVLCASPNYLATTNPVTHPDALKESSCLVYSLSSSPRKWQFRKENETVSVDIQPATYSVNNGIALKQAAVLGLGIILVPEDFVRTELDAGDLVQVMPGWEPDSHSLYAMYPYHKEQSQKIRLFIDFVIEAFNRRENDSDKAVLS